MPSLLLRIRRSEIGVREPGLGPPRLWPRSTVRPTARRRAHLGCIGLSLCEQLILSFMSSGLRGECFSSSLFGGDVADLPPRLRTKHVALRYLSAGTLWKWVPIFLAGRRRRSRHRPGTGARPQSQSSYLLTGKTNVQPLVRVADSPGAESVHL